MKSKSFWYLLVKVVRLLKCGDANAGSYACVVYIVYSRLDCRLFEGVKPSSMGCVELLASIMQDKPQGIPPKVRAK